MARDEDDRDFDDDVDPLDDARGGSASASDFPAKALFASGSPREILARLVDGDPLELEARAAERLRERGLLLELERVVLRSMARAAHAGFAYRGDPPLDEWLVTRIDDAIADLLREDEEAEHGGIPPEQPLEQRLRFISSITGLEPILARRACLRFNSLPQETRLAFFEVVIAQKRFNRYVSEGHGPPAKLRQQLLDAFEALSLPLDPGAGKGGW